MNCKKMITRTFLIGPVLAAIIGAGVLVGCTGDTGPEGGRDSGSATATQEISEGQGGESSGEHGGEGSESGSGGEEGSGAANMLALDDTFDMVRAGARLILRYDAPSNSFKGTVENTTNGVLSQVRIEVHLSNGVELGPTTPRDMAPGEVVSISMPATAASFTGWTPHAEVGGGEGSGGEGSGGEGSESGGEGGAESGEAAMSSPIVPLGQTWNGILGGLAVSARYDAATQTVHATVQNTLSQVLCYVQAEPHLKSGTKTVGELGPDVLGHLSPGQEATSSVSVASEPNLAGVSFDGYVVHLEVFDCAGSGPVPHTGGAGAESRSGESGTESGSESSGGSEEGSGAVNMLAPDETFDAIRGGAQLILRVRRSKQLLQGNCGEHDQRRPGPGQDRSAPFERNGARSDDSDVNMAPSEVADGQPALRRRHRSPDGQHMPRLVPVGEGSELGRGIRHRAWWQRQESLAANTAAVVASGGEAARASRGRPRENVEVSSGII